MTFATRIEYPKLRTPIPSTISIVTTSVALRLSQAFLDDTVVPGVLFVVNANRADFRLSPRVDWLVTGAVTVSLGADIFEGARRTLYGQFDRNDRVWLTTTWKF